MQVILSVLVWCLKNAWSFFIIIMLLVGILVFIFRLSIGGSLYSYTSRLVVITGIAIVFFISIFITVIAYVRGNYLSSEIIYHYGENSTAIVLSRESTGIVYNLHPIFKYAVRYKLADNSEIESGFKDSDFILYPNKSDMIHPNINDSLTIKYLPTFPQYFIIVTN